MKRFRSTRAVSDIEIHHHYLLLSRSAFLLDFTFELGRLADPARRSDDAGRVRRSPLDWPGISIKLHSSVALPTPLKSTCELASPGMSTNLLAAIRWNMLENIEEYLGESILRSACSDWRKTQLAESKVRLGNHLQIDDQKAGSLSVNCETNFNRARQSQITIHNSRSELAGLKDHFRLSFTFVCFVFTNPTGRKRQAPPSLSLPLSPKLFEMRSVELALTKCLQAHDARAHVLDLFLLEGVVAVRRWPCG